MSAALAALLLAAPALAQVSVAPDIRLRDQHGRDWTLSAHARRPALVLVAFTAGCPIQRRLMPTLRELQRRYESRGVAFAFIDPSPQDDAASVREEVRAYGVTAPVLLDPDQSVSAALGFTRSAEAAVLRPGDRRLLYRGAVDDQHHYDGSRPSASRRWLAQALDEVLAGREPAVSRSEPFGCFINYVRPREKVVAGTLPALTSLGLFIALEKGFFAAEGLDVELRLLPSNDALLPQLEDGRLDAGGAGLNAAFYATAARGGVKAVADKGRTAGRGFRALVSSKRLRPEPLDAAALRGRRFALSVPGYESERLVERWLRGRGLELSDVVLATMPYARMGAALAEGRVFGAVLIEPFLSDAVRAGAVAVEADAADLYPGQQGAAVLFSSRFIEERRGAALRFLRAYARACRWYRDARSDPAELRAIAGRVLRREPAALEGMGWPGLDPDGRLDAESAAADLRWHQARGSAPAALSPEAMADGSLLEEALRR